MHMTLVVDNFDSFTFNLVQLLLSLDSRVEVRRNNEVSLDDIMMLAPERILISPGPGRPEQIEILKEIICRCSSSMSILGVCLGHQAIAHAFRGRIGYAQKPMHGKTSEINHSGEAIFRGLKNPLKVNRYHSLVVERSSLPSDLVVTAESDEGEIMGIQHIHRPVYGVQFHPESILTEDGGRILSNWLSQ